MSSPVRWSRFTSPAPHALPSWREAADYIVDASSDGKAWEQIRMAHLFDDDGKLAVACGLYACSPKAAGFAAEFSFLEITEGRLVTP